MVKLTVFSRVLVCACGGHDGCGTGHFQGGASARTVYLYSRRDKCTRTDEEPNFKVETGVLSLHFVLNIPGGGAAKKLENDIIAKYQMSGSPGAASFSSLS